MKTKFLAGVLLAAVGTLALVAFSVNKDNAFKKRTTYKSMPQGCVFRTLMGEEESAGGSIEYFTPENVEKAIRGGLSWVIKAQHPTGGWGAGSHSRQDVMDPHAVQPDPATTSAVAMALLRSGHSLTKGDYANQMRRAVNFLLEQVEASSKESPTITTLTGTQIQSKLGANIDVILTSQFLSNLLDGHLDFDPTLRERVRSANGVCISKIQSSLGKDGSVSGSGWAGVLQSSFATNAMEAAQAQGVAVDDKALERARQFQKDNYNTETGEVKTDLGAGVMLYSVTGSARASAKEARRVEEEMANAKRDGRLAQAAAPSASNLEKLGYTREDAIKYATAYEVYQSAKVKSQQADVLEGFGNNGGEEFLSYLQTGESMIIGKDNAWKKWYDTCSGRLIQIQNDDGSWNGHHCITSPVFCTATCLLILAVNNDVERLVAQGAK